MATKNKNSSVLIVAAIFAIVAIAVLGVVVSQTNSSKSQTQMKARAADPCEAYPKLSPIVTDTRGTVHDKTDVGFSWWENGVSTKVKVVVVCAGAKLTRQFGATIPYSDINEGDSVAMTGNYGDTTKTTILATWVRNFSTSKAGEYKAKVATVNHSQSSFTLSGVTLLVAGKYGPYTLTVNYTPNTKCYFRTKQKPFACTNIAVGNSVAVTGVLYDPTLTLTAENIVVNY